jgi:hypothetical protein
MTAAANVTAWLVANPKPDPQALAERYGGYARVPVAEWLKLDRLIVAWRKTALAKLDALATTLEGYRQRAVTHDEKLREAARATQAAHEGAPARQRR